MMLDPRWQVRYMDSQAVFLERHLNQNPDSTERIHGANRVISKSKQRNRMKRKPEGRARPKDLWRLPSGRNLAEFALASGFLAPPLLESGRGAVERKGA
jgi:hypothetical protein